jgi:hypothetical protein
MLAPLGEILARLTVAQLVWTAVMFVTVYAVAFGLFFVPYDRYDRLWREGAHTTAVVIAKEPHNHANVRYKYSVAGTEHESTSNTGYAGIPPLDRIQIGQTVTITYWPKRPWVSTLGDPVNQRAFFLAHLVFAPFALAFFLAVGVVFRISNQAMRPTASPRTASLLLD